MAWTPAGGEILFIEATDMSSGQVTLTGKLGDVMKESAMIPSAFSSRDSLNSINLRTGSSYSRAFRRRTEGWTVSGIALFTALASLFTGKRVNPSMAMTGEITLRGAVLPIGGLKERC